jgi:uncharacterized protein (TIGR04255 family)
MSSTDRPDFENPPVIEVVCGVQFEGVDEWKTPHYGLYWDRLGGEYPDSEEQQPLPRLRLDVKKLEEPIQIPLLPPLRRVFFVKPPGNFLIQVQPYRFLYNWRRVQDSDIYPRFDAPYEGFVKEWDRFRSFVDDLKLGQVQPETFELTYINHIFDRGVSFPRDVWRYMGFYGATPQATTARDATGLALQVSWPLPDNLGTLVLDMKHGHRMKDEGEVLVLELSARGKAGDNAADMNHWFSIAHTAIVTTFAALTTNEAHILWGKK